MRDSKAKEVIYERVYHVYDDHSRKWDTYDTPEEAVAEVVESLHNAEARFSVTVQVAERPKR